MTAAASWRRAGSLRIVPVSLPTASCWPMGTWEGSGCILPPPPGAANSAQMCRGTSAAWPRGDVLLQDQPRAWLCGDVALGAFAHAELNQVHSALLWETESMLWETGFPWLSAASAGTQTALRRPWHQPGGWWGKYCVLPQLMGLEDMQ